MQSKQPKTPALGSKTKILCFDLETNGLHGEAFAAGAVVMDTQGSLLDEFSGRAKIVGQVDPWVEHNVLPVLKDMPITHKSYKDLREDFWKWYLQAEPQADYVLVSNGYPVEYRFLLKCQEENLDERYWQHPFPILDLTSILLATGHNPSSKGKLINGIISAGKFSRHHPLDDAKIAALAAIKALSLA
ncbi:MAG TPA: hypothetical protein VLG13_01990 [Patescibacteria group bacterium]|nr:hypothetical protein [Patescibacteria group bacterium]